MHFPIIELPYSHTFSDQIQALYDAPHIEKENWLKNKLSIQKELITFSYDQKNLDAYFAKVAKFIHYPFALITNQAEVLYNKTDKDETELIQHWYGIEKGKNVITATDQYIQIILRQKEEKYGYLFIMMDKNVGITKEEEEMFLQIGEILSNFFANAKLVNPTKLFDQAFSLLIARYLKDDITMNYLSNQLKGDNKRLSQYPYWVIMTLKEQKNSENQFLSLQQEFDMHPFFKKFIIKHVKYAGNMLTVLFDPHKEDTLHLSTTKLVTPLKEVLQAAKEKNSYTMVVSQKKSSLERIDEGKKECVEAIQIAEDMSFETPVIMYENLEFISLFRHIPLHLLENYYKNTLESFVNQGSTYEKDMLDTLQMYVDCDGNVKEAADQLFVHRNTVAYRLDKICKLLKIDLKNTNDLLRIKIALIFHQMRTI